MTLKTRQLTRYHHECSTEGCHIRLTDEHADKLGADLALAGAIRLGEAYVNPTAPKLDEAYCTIHAPTSLDAANAGAAP